MTTQPASIFGPQSLLALFKGWAALLGSFILCLGAQIPALSKVQTPENPLIGDYMSFGILAGALLCALAVLLSLPPLVRLAASGRDTMRAYITTPTQWTLVLGTILGAVAIFIAIKTGDSAGAAFFASLIFVFTVMIVPVLMTSISYWFLLVRPAAGHEGGAQAVTLYSVLLILWNVYAYVIASALIHTPAPTPLS